MQNIEEIRNTNKFNKLYIRIRLLSDNRDDWVESFTATYAL